MEKHQRNEIDAPKYDTFISETSMLKDVFSISTNVIFTRLQIVASPEPFLFFDVIHMFSDNGTFHDL